MELKELYTAYGELVIQAEIVQGRIMEVKKKIAEALNQPKPKEPNEQGEVH